MAFVSDVFLYRFSSFIKLQGVVVTLHVSACERYDVSVCVTFFFDSFGIWASLRSWCWMFEFQWVRCQLCGAWLPWWFVFYGCIFWCICYVGCRFLTFCCTLRRHYFWKEFNSLGAVNWILCWRFQYCILLLSCLEWWAFGYVALL